RPRRRRQSCCRRCQGSSGRRRRYRNCEVSFRVTDDQLSADLVSTSPRCTYSGVRYLKVKPTHLCRPNLRVTSTIIWSYQKDTYYSLDKIWLTVGRYYRPRTSERQLYSKRGLTMKWAFVRHGRTEWSRKRLVQGRADNPLNAEGYFES